MVSGILATGSVNLMDISSSLKEDINIKYTSLEKDILKITGYFLFLERNFLLSLKEARQAWKKQSKISSYSHYNGYRKRGFRQKLFYKLFLNGISSCRYSLQL